MVPRTALPSRRRPCKRRRRARRGASAQSAGCLRLSSLKNRNGWRNWSTIAPPQGERGPSQAQEREVAEDNSAARKWDEFYKRIEVGGDSGRSYSDEELDKWLEDLSEKEIQALEGKLKCRRFEDAFPRAMHSVLEDVFYLVQTANWHLKRDGHTRAWLENIALHMFQFQSALRKAQELAGEIEKRTGISGEDLAWE